MAARRAARRTIGGPAIGSPDANARERRRGGRRWIDGRPAYLAVTLGLAAAGLWTAARAGLEGLGAAAAGVAVAWGIQAGAVWALVGELDAGRPVLKVWVAGIAGRVGGLGLAWAVAALTGMSARTVVVAYGATILGLLLGEAAWLALRRRPGAGDRNR